MDLAEQAGVSQSLVARVERGGAARLTVRRLEALGEELGARVVVRLEWNGEDADRLLDGAHAALVDAVAAALVEHGWEVVPEATFAIYGERGSIDILAWHEASATLLVVEVKSVVPDMQSMLGSLDRKMRLADSIARSRGWRPGRIGCLLAIQDGTTARRRVEQHAATFDARFPDRAIEVRQFIRDPGAARRALRGLWFVPISTEATRGRRVRKPKAGG